MNYQSSGDPDVPWVINDILPRRNVLPRPPISNLDILLVTVAATLPEIDYFLIDRLLAYAFFHQIEPILIVSKNDQNPLQENIDNFLANYRATGFKIFFTELTSELNIEEIKSAIAGKNVAFAGQSGVGKSTLINRLFGSQLMEIGQLSEKGKRGKQTTRHVELFPVDGGYIADTPGFQTINLYDLQMSEDDFAAGYPEIKQYSDQCRFRSCRHMSEPDCAVKEHAGMHPDRYERYCQLRKQLAEEIKQRQY